MKNFFSIATLILGIIATGSPVVAQSGFYVGLEGGQSRTELRRESDGLILNRGILLGTSSDRDGTTLGIYGGYTFAKHFGIELSYADLGEASFTTIHDIEPIIFLPPGFSPYPPTAGFIGGFRAILFRQEQRLTFESQALSVALLGRYEFASTFSIFGRAGIAIHRYEVGLESWIDGVPVRVIGGPDDQSAGAAVLGLGAEWGFHPNWALRLQGQRHFAIGEESVNLIEREDVTTVTAGIRYRF